MPPRLPTNADFPSSLTLTITPPPSGQPPLNVLLLLHGLGDTHHPFTSFARALHLPYTACLSLRGPSPVPAFFTGSDAPSFHWGDDIQLSSTTGGLDLDCGYDRAVAQLSTLISDALVARCGFAARDVFLLGFGQGAVPALLLAARNPGVEYGGVVAIGGRLPASFTRPEGEVKARSPLLLLGGSRSGEVTRGAVEGVRAAFAEVEYVRWEKGEDSMPRNREEMLPVMRFLARRLASRQGVPEGAVEVGR